jgi:hypothetical protein
VGRRGRRARETTAVFLLLFPDRRIGPRNWSCACGKRIARWGTAGSREGTARREGRGEEERDGRVERGEEGECQERGKRGGTRKSTRGLVDNVSSDEGRGRQCEERRKRGDAGVGWRSRNERKKKRKTTNCKNGCEAPLRRVSSVCASPTAQSCISRETAVM